MKKEEREGEIEERAEWTDEGGEGDAKAWPTPGFLSRMCAPLGGVGARGVLGWVML